MQRIAREPLVHFLIGGLAIFLFSAWRGEAADPASRTIRVTAADRAQLALGFENTMARPPTERELHALVNRWVHDEVLYREALRLGLDDGDPVIRRRLTQKMDVIAASAADAIQPGTAQLQAWLEAHPDRFTPDTSLTFDQLYFGDPARAEVAKVRLAQGAAWREAGDAVSLSQTLRAASRTAVADQFGTAFAEAVGAMTPGELWQGPIETDLGWHLVRLRARKAGALPPLAAIRQRVEDDWRAETERARQDAGFRLLRGAYTVTVAK